MQVDFLPEGSALELVTAAEEPETWVANRPQFGAVWPEYNNHGGNTGVYFDALIPQFAHLQFLIMDRETGQAIARGRTIPLHWDGTLEDLPSGIDAAGLRAVEARRPATAISALAAEVVQHQQGKQVSRLVLLGMAAVARAAHLGPLVAPVRPSRKDRYPLIPIDQYATWRNSDGRLFDPWLRVHERLGARVLRPEPRSLEIEAPVGDWETWTEMVFPADGDYVFPQGLAPLEVRDGRGLYWEPNVWMLHDV
jgi:hypothetical protein